MLVYRKQGIRAKHTGVIIMNRIKDGSYSLTCIKCPRGCHVSANIVDGEVQKVEGNFCPRGDDYIRQELIDPKRTVTTTVRLNGSKLQSQVPVKTDQEISKYKVQDVIEALANTELYTPVSIGDVVVENICNTGANIVITKTIK